MRQHNYAYAYDAVPPRFTAKERDSESGLDYFGALYMSSAQGRFTSVDPKLDGVPYPEHVLAPQRWNRYAHALNNPLKLFDPSGQDAEFVISFQGNFTGEEKAKILERLRGYLGSPRGLAGKVKDMVSGRRDFATLTISSEPSGNKHLPDKVFASDFAQFRKDSSAFATVIADAVLHETLSHQLQLGADPKTALYMNQSATLIQLVASDRQ
jgi:RHS repeat-associated protein